jgi:2-polyprenyl-6-methoxyphenol hydroxylase-like FAD-dependent oxidoreductase
MQETRVPAGTNLPDRTLSSPDLLIVGAGPAGLAAAIAATNRGLRVHVVDSSQPIIDKACGEGLLPAAVESLTQLGVDLSSVPHASFRGIRFLDATTEATSTAGLFREAPGIGIRRTRLYQVLLDRALALGVSIQWQSTVHAIPNQNPEALTVETNTGTFRPRYLVGADGLHSKVRTLAGLSRASSTRSRIGIRQHFATTPHTDLVEVYWSPIGQAYVTPISRSELCIAFVYNSRPPKDHLAAFPALQARLRSATAIDPPRGAVTLTRSLHRVTSGNIALIGDASGSVDAVTGKGLALCFQQALTLADALAENNLSAYQQAHTRLLKAPLLMSRALLLMDRHPPLRSLALKSLRRHPFIFPNLLDIHVGLKPLRTLSATGLLTSLFSLFLT